MRIASPRPGAGPRLALTLLAALSLATGAFAQTVPQEVPPETAEAAAEAAVPPPGEAPPPEEGQPADETSAPPERYRLVLLRFRIHSARPLGYLTESLSGLLGNRLEATGEVEVIDPDRVQEELRAGDEDLSDVELRRLAQRLDADAVVSGSLTELAGRFSLDARVTPVEGVRSHTIVMTTADEEELLGRLPELASRVTATLAGVAPSLIADVLIEGAGEIEPDLRFLIDLEPGDVYDPERAQQARERIEGNLQVASATVDTDLTEAGVVLTFRVVRSEAIFGETGVESGGEKVIAVHVRGNRRIESDAIRARVGTRVGEPVRPAQIAADVQEIFNLGFFANVQAFQDVTPEGIVLVFEVEENPVIRQISISGNDEIEGDKIRDALTLTTGSTLDYPLLHENKARIESLYRAEGYYLAHVSFEIEELREGSIAINFDVDEGEKLHLVEIIFEGNEAFSAQELTEAFETKTWVPVWSTLTAWFTKAGTYSEPIFIRDIQTVEKKYTDNGYLQVEVGEPEVEPREEGLFVRVEIREGDQYRVGSLVVTGDATIDLEGLRKKLKLEEARSSTAPS